MGVTLGDWDGKPKGEFLDDDKVMGYHLVEFARDWVSPGASREQKEKLFKSLSELDLRLMKMEGVERCSTHSAPMMGTNCISHCAKCNEGSNQDAWPCNICDECAHELRNHCEGYGGSAAKITIVHSAHSVIYMR
jgi:hypothetical protein